MGESKWLSTTQTYWGDTYPTVCPVTLVPSGGWSSKDEATAATGWRNRCEHHIVPVALQVLDPGLIAW